jgi:hypothetical protein
MFLLSLAYKRRGVVEDKSLKFKVFLAVLAICCIEVMGFQAANAEVPVQPTVVSFSMSPDSVDISTSNNVVSFDLIVSSPSGIASTQSMATLTSGNNSTIAVPLRRTDSPINSALSTVEFKGSITLPSTILSGLYSATASPVSSLTSTGLTGYSTLSINASNTSTLIGAPNLLQVRSGGNLNFNYATFVGPTFNTLSGSSVTDPRFNFVAPPIWKVGEKFNPNDYYQLNVPTLALKVKSSTPATCTSNGTTLALISVGACSFSVYTDQTADYQYRHDDENVTITVSRIKPSYSVGSISTQPSSTLPLVISGPLINGPFGVVIPLSATPTVCYSTGSFITILSGGTCTLNYYTPASGGYLESDVYPLTFQISRTQQIITFSAPANVALASKTIMLVATSSSKEPVTFQSDSPVICSVTGNSLNLLKAGSCQVEARQAGTTTIAPASSVQSIMVTGNLAPSIKKLICLKNGKSKTFTGKKCPLGYKAKK